jgi:hypothetical protein
MIAIKPDVIIDEIVLFLSAICNSCNNNILGKLLMQLFIICPHSYVPKVSYFVRTEQCPGAFLRPYCIGNCLVVRKMCIWHSLWQEG